MVVTGQQNVGLADDNEQDALHKIEALLNAPADTKTGGVRLVGPGGDAVELPPTVARLLTYMIGQMAHGKGIAISSELTVEEAATILDFPPSHVELLLTQGELSATKVNGAYHLAIKDVLAYKEAWPQRRREMLDEITRLGQEIEQEIEMAAAEHTGAGRT